MRLLVLGRDAFDISWVSTGIRVAVNSAPDHYVEIGLDYDRSDLRVERRELQALCAKCGTQLDDM